MIKYIKIISIRITIILQPTITYAVTPRTVVPAPIFNYPHKEMNNDIPRLQLEDGQEEIVSVYRIIL